MSLKFMNLQKDTVESGILEDIFITPDIRTNSLIISAPAKTMELLLALIKDLDVAPLYRADIKIFTLHTADATAMAADPLAQHDALCLLSEQEQHRLLVQLNDTRATFSEAKCIHNLFEAQAEAMPDGANNFYSSDKVNRHTVSFNDQYQMKVAGNLFTPRTLDPGGRATCS